MARAIRVISVQRGHDPRDYTLVAFGGAGPLHAARLAKELEIGRILVPRNPGILCAMGLLLTDLRADFATTRLHALSTAALPDIADAFRVLRAQADAWFEDEGIAIGARRITRTVDMRYAGQNYELPIPLPEGEIGQPRARCVGGGLSPRRIGACTALPPTMNRCSWSPTGSKLRASCQRRRFSRTGCGAGCVRCHRGAPRCVAVGSRWLRSLVRSTIASGCIGQPHRRPGDRRADGCDDGGAAWHGGTRRSVSEPDPGAGMNNIASGGAPIHIARLRERSPR